MLPRSDASGHALLVRGSGVRCLLVGLVCGAACLVAPAAGAFENQWQLGFSLGPATALHRSLGWGPSVALDGVYGLSDTFDAEVFLQGFQLPNDGNRSWRAGLVAAGVAYKLDIIQWVPKLGLHAGYFGATTEISGAQDVRLPQAGVLVGVVPGLDYAYSRSLGLGISGRFESILSRRVPPSLVSVILSAEYRWGW
ncbi:MAG: hypothetical protein SFV15_23805 [Polyangiaceae bacterium]|nr:hypothetical protein [Polyangiaceae bacterium]